MVIVVLRFLKIHLYPRKNRVRKKKNNGCLGFQAVDAGDVFCAFFLCRLTRSMAISGSVLSFNIFPLLIFCFCIYVYAYSISLYAKNAEILFVRFYISSPVAGFSRSMTAVNNLRYLFI